MEKDRQVSRHQYLMLENRAAGSTCYQIRFAFWGVYRDVVQLLQVGYLPLPHLSILSSRPYKRNESKLCDYQLLLINHEFSAGPYWLCVSTKVIHSVRKWHTTFMLCLFKASLPERACHWLQNSKHSNSMQQRQTRFSYVQFTKCAQLLIIPNQGRTAMNWSRPLPDLSQTKRLRSESTGCKALQRVCQIHLSPRTHSSASLFPCFILWIKVFGTAYHGTSFLP